MMQKQERMRKMAVTTVTKDNFEAVVLQAEKPVLIDFYATWCGPCRMVSPLVDEIAEEYQNYQICKVDVDESPELAQKFGVMSIPTLVVLKQGKVITQNVGALPKNAILDLLEQAEKYRKVKSGRFECSNLPLLCFSMHLISRQQ